MVKTLIKMSTDKMSMWEAQWAKGDTSFHLAEVNDRLLSYMNELVGVVTNGTTDPAAKNILVPLCGKSKDLVHLHSLGHTVVGCEGVEQVDPFSFQWLQVDISLVTLIYCRRAQSFSVKTTLNTRGVPLKGWTAPFSQ